VIILSDTFEEFAKRSCAAECRAPLPKLEVVNDRVVDIGYAFQSEARAVAAFRSMNYHVIARATLSRHPMLAERTWASVSGAGGYQKQFPQFPAARPMRI